LPHAINIVVTGASGFLGRPLVEKLGTLGHAVVPLDLQLGHNLLLPECLDDLPPFQALIHLAARTFIPESYKVPREFYETNVLSTLNCLDACRKRGASLVLASTYVYGPPEYLPVDEKHPVRKWNPYSTSKILAEELCEAYALHHDVPARVLRLFNLFGPGHAPHFLIPKILEGIRAGSVNLSTPEPRRDFVYVKDVVDAFALAAVSQWSGFGCFNVGTGASHSVAEVVDKIQGALGTDVPVQYEGELRDGEVMDVRADISLIRQTLGWEPKFGLTTGLGDFLSPDGGAHEKD
jgi:GDP-4-dehydro-6-deoxy-D-mannose reductase